jgi:HK97 gp10 family phage protein
MALDADELMSRGMSRGSVRAPKGGGPVTLGIQGGAELAAALRDFPVKFEARVMAAALREGAKEIERRAKELAPVRTGKLRDSIKIRRRTNKRTGYINFFVSAGDRKKGVFYAHMVEYGTRAHEIRPKNGKSLFFAGLLRQLVNHPGAKPSGFMRTAHDEGNQEALRLITDRVRKGVAQLTRRRAKGRI